VIAALVLAAILVLAFSRWRNPAPADEVEANAP
jgi:hypothetical protein